MSKPGRHVLASVRCVRVTAALASCVDRLELPAEPGISPRAVRTVLRMMSKIANDAGEFRYGLRGSKLAALTDYSLSVIRRAQRYLVDHGFLERVEVGGGRTSTRWRILVAKLHPAPASRHSSPAPTAQQPCAPDTAQERRPKSFTWMNRGAAMYAPTPTPPPVFAAVQLTTCAHGGDGTRLASGQPRCPSCRRASQPRQRT